MQIGLETEKHLLLSLDSVPEEEFTIYHENGGTGRELLRNCPSNTVCLEYLLNEAGLGLGTKISRHNAQTILANYCCGNCNDNKHKN